MEPFSLDCPHCGITVMIPKELPIKPAPGHHTICLKCNTVYILQDDLTGRLLREDEKELLPFREIFNLLLLKSLLRGLERTEQIRKEHAQNNAPMFNKFSEN